MRHYFGYRADGSLGSVNTFHGGWPEDKDLRDPNSPDVTIQKQRARLAKRDIIGFLAFDCECPSGPSGPGSCNCASFAHRTKYMKDGALVSKAGTSVMHVDGNPIADGERLIRAPGTKVIFQMVCPDVPDGQSLNVQIRSAILHPSNTHHLLVTGGKTDTLELTAPAQGAFGQVLMGGVQFIPARFDLVGFA
jgi:hypothetical protein